MTTDCTCASVLQAMGDSGNTAQSLMKYWHLITPDCTCAFVPQAMGDSSSTAQVHPERLTKY